MVKINKDTQLYISIAERPGNLGSVFFNTLFERLSIDAIYKPLLVKSEDLEWAVRGIRALNIRGCGVSMPHKQRVIKYLDKIDSVVKKIGAVNTIVNKENILWGYNTDYIGVKTVLLKVPNIKGKKVLLMGAGGMARAAIVALKDIGINQIIITNRTVKTGKALASEFDLKYHQYNTKDNIKADVLINATAVGMLAEDTSPISVGTLRGYELIVDVVVAPQKTKLIKNGEKIGLKVISGLEIKIEQAVAQFKFYTGMTPPKDVVENIFRRYYSV